VRLDEFDDPLGVQPERLRGTRDAVAEPHAQRPVDPDPQVADDPLAVRLHGYIPSNPSSVRARSITSGVISPMPRWAA
jgi:hypothetical protein